MNTGLALDETLSEELAEVLHADALHDRLGTLIDSFGEGNNGSDAKVTKCEVETSSTDLCRLRRRL